MIKFFLGLTFIITFCSCTSIRTEHYIKLDHHIQIDINATNINLNMNHTHRFKDNNLTDIQKQQAIRNVENIMNKYTNDEKTQD